MKWLKLGIVAILVLGLMIPAVPVYADTADPDATPTVDRIIIERNLLTTGDILILISANIPYASLPSTPVTETFIWRLIDTDGVTELGSTVGYAYNDDGYGYNLYSMYFSAAEVTALGIVWGTSYAIRLSGNPANFDTPPVYNYSIAAADYTSLSDTADVQAELEAWILTLADELNNRWGLATSVQLLEESEAGTVLSIYGEAFFRGAIYGLQAFAPRVFSVIIRTIDIDDREWDTEYAENVSSQWVGSWVETSRAAGRALFGTDYNLLDIIILSVMCVGLLIGNLMLTASHWNGLVDCAFLAVIAARLGMYDLAFLILVAAICWLYIGTQIWFKLVKI